jgi:hypothetical protein
MPGIRGEIPSLNLFSGHKTSYHEETESIHQHGGITKHGYQASKAEAKSEPGKIFFPSH